MKCQNCGIKTRPGSQYCHDCGTKIESFDISKGGNFVRVAFVFMGILPAIQGMCSYLLLASSVNFFTPISLINIFFVGAIIILIIFLYRGKLWTINPIGIFIIISGSLNCLVGLISYGFDALFLVRLIFGIIYIGFGFIFLRSEDVRAFVKDRANNVA